MTTDIRLTDADLERIERHQAAPRYDVLGTTAHCAECGDDWPCDVVIARRVATTDLTRLRAVAAAARAYRDIMPVARYQDEQGAESALDAALAALENGRTDGENGTITPTE